MPNLRLDLGPVCLGSGLDRGSEPDYGNPSTGEREQIVRPPVAMGMIWADPFCSGLRLGLRCGLQYRGGAADVSVTTPVYSLMLGRLNARAW